MNKAYLAKIIAKDSQGLQLISAFCSEAKVKVDRGIQELKTPSGVRNKKIKKKIPPK